MKSLDAKDRIREIEAFALRNRCPLGPGSLETRMVMRIHLGFHRPGHGGYQKMPFWLVKEPRKVSFTSDAGSDVCVCGKAASSIQAYWRIGVLAPDHWVQNFMDKK
jgi:hypothetical protein